MVGKTLRQSIDLPAPNNYYHTSSHIFPCIRELLDKHIQFLLEGQTQPCCMSAMDPSCTPRYFYPTRFRERTFRSIVHNS